ncbi:AAA family ATPase [Streptomyces griseorubiginosus]|uniref:AAA family ATPase n=1 Tax=Streptomyces griseorubiginosus TaxID=67304 RepID=UPI001AD6CC5B|nr:AAA family ATPase [Streptomyces griseorubiginosus]MBO4254776.1 AAA family ATPase [Streptomyces griseorubiginosus]
MITEEGPGKASAPEEDAESQTEAVTPPVHASPFSRPRQPDGFAPTDDPVTYGGYSASVYFALVDQCAAQPDTERRQDLAKAWFPFESDFTAFVRLVQNERDRIAEDRETRERKEQKQHDDYARRQDAAREKVKREKVERRLSGELDPATQRFLDAFETGLLDVDQMLSLPRPHWLIDGVLCLDSLAWLAGPSNTYKSFLALDIAARAAFGMTYHGDDRPMAMARSLVVVAEGAGAYGDRIRAWERKNRREIPRDQVMFYPRAVQLSDLVVEMPALLAHVKRQREQGTGYGLIIFDTQAMCTVGVNENDNTEMGVVVNVLHQLREATGACILLVHHFGSDDAKGMRGATAIYAAATTVVAVKRKGDLKVALSTRAPKGKQKDAEAVDAFVLDLEKVGDIEEGWGSLVPARGIYSGSDIRVTPTVNARQHVILSSLAETDQVGGLGVTAIARHVSEAEGPNPNTGKSWAPSTTASWMNTLVRRELVKKTGANYTITELGREAFADFEGRGK